MDNVSLFFAIFHLNGDSRVLDYLMLFSTNHLIYLAILMTFILAVKGKLAEKKAFLIILLSLPVAILLIKGIHLFIFEPRPFITYDLIPLESEPNNASFPSRHATIAAILAFPYVFYQSKLGPLFLLMMLWVGFSRIYVGVHYPLDVLGGFVTGLVALAISFQIKKRIKMRLFT